MGWRLVSPKLDAAVSRWMNAPVTDLKSHTHAPSPANWLTRPTQFDPSTYWWAVGIAIVFGTIGALALS